MRRDYDAALQLAAGRADGAYERQQYQQAAAPLKMLLDVFQAHDVTQWKLTAVAYRKLVALDNQIGNSAATVSDLINLGRACIKEGDFETALAACDSALRLDQRNVNALNQKARALAYKRRYRDAFAILEQSLAISEDNPRTLFLKAGILANDGRFAEALQVYEHVRQLSPSYPELGRAIAETKRQLDWKAKAMEGAATAEPVHGDRRDPDRIPAIERKAQTGSEPKDQAIPLDLQQLYDEAISEPRPEKQEPSPPAQETLETIPIAQDLLQKPVADTKASAAEADPIPAPMPEIPLPTPVGSEASALTPPPYPVQRAAAGEQKAAEDAEREEMEEQLIRVLGDLRTGTLKADSLLDRLSTMQQVKIPLSLGVLFFRFFHMPQDPTALRELLTWLSAQKLERLPLPVLEVAVEAGQTLDTSIPIVHDALLQADADAMSPALRGQRATLLLAQGDAKGYVQEELAALRAAAPGVSHEAIARQLEQVLDKCGEGGDCVRLVLEAAGDLGVEDQLMDRITADPELSKVPAFENVVVAGLARTEVDENTFLRHEALFQKATFGPEKAAILHRILQKAVHPAVRRKLLQSLLVLATPDNAEVTELVSLMARDHDTTNAMYVMQFLIDHHASIQNGGDLLKQLAGIVSTDYEDRYALGLAADALQEPSMATGFYLAALQAQPGDGEAVQHVLSALLTAHTYDLLEEVGALSHLAPDQLETAVEAAGQQVQVEPADAKLVETWASYAGGRYEEAVAAGSSTVRAGGDARFYLPMALSFVKLGLPELAVRELERGMRLPRLDPGLKMVMMYRSGQIQLALGNTAQAAPILQEVRAQAPGFRDVDALLARCESDSARILNF